MESVDRRVEEYKQLILEISSEPDTSKRERLEANLTNTLNSQMMVIILQRILPNPENQGIHRSFPSILGHSVLLIRLPPHLSIVTETICQAEAFDPRNTS